MAYKKLFSEFYNGKKVFLTGHTGFKGTWLLMWLSEIGAQVKGYALEPENREDLYNAVNGASLGDSVIADIRDGERLQKEILSFQPDIIFHLAAQPLVRRSYEQPLYTYEVNVNGTANLLEAVRDLDKKCIVIIITTDKVYANREINHAYTETDPLGGYDPYSASKAAAEIVTSSYRDSFFNPSHYEKHQKAIATARAGNVIGGGDWSKDRIVPDIVRALQTSKEVIVRHPNAVRPWQHVLEPLSGYLLLGVKMTEDPLRFSTSWNFGPDDQDIPTVKELVMKAIGIWGNGSYVTPDLGVQPHEAGLLKLDIQKAATELGWHPQMNAEEAIEKTITWYKDAGQGNSFTITQQQILQFQELR